MNANEPNVILPTEVEAGVSGVSRVEIAPDKTVSLVYENRARVSARLERLSHAVQSNFLALVRRVQNAARANGRKVRHARIT